MISNDKSDGRPKTSYERASAFSRLYCLYAFPIFLLSHRKELKLDDIEHNSQCHSSDHLGGQLRRNWNKELCRKSHGKSASIVRALFRTFGWTFAWITLCNLIAFGLFQLSMSLLLGRIIRYSTLYYQQKAQLPVNGTVEGNRDILLDLTSRENVMLYSVALGLLVLLNVAFTQPYFMVKYRLGMQVRVALSRLVYEKALRVTSATVHRHKPGKVVNLIANDANRFELTFLCLEFAFMALVHTVALVTFMYHFIGRASLAPLAIVLLYIPYQALMGKILSRLRAQSALLTDDRLRLMSEIVPAMRVIKMYVWERPFAQLVHKCRLKEVSKIRERMLLRCLYWVLYFVSSKVISFVVIVLFVLDGGELSAEVVFVLLSLVSQVKDGMAKQFPVGIAVAADTYISAKRINTFLLDEEINNDQLKSESIENSNVKNSTISLHKVTVSVDGASILKNVSFKVSPRQLTVIIGPVGSGKSSILMSILGELPIEKQNGQIEVHGRIAYASQEAWIFGGATVRDNILFGQQFEPKRYGDVIKVFALESDFDQLVDGDSTRVDDRGTSLSGGQRARISLARALYHNADCYLLDDPLSAVDAAVAKHIFEQCIKNYLRDKCVLLVTHQLQFIKQADQIVLLREGECIGAGSYGALTKRGIDLFKYTSKSAQQEAELNDSQKNTHRSRSNSKSLQEETKLLVNDQTVQVAKQVKMQNAKSTVNNLDKQNDEQASKPSSEQSTLRAYWSYMRAGSGTALLTLFLTSNIVAQVLFTGIDFWLSIWTDQRKKLAIKALNHSVVFDRSPLIAQDESDNMVIYSAIVAILFIFSLLRTVSFFSICTRASIHLHNRLFSSLIQAPIGFFDRTPIGIIMNRVSTDLTIIDEHLSNTGFEALDILGNSLGIFVLCMALNYFIVLPFLVVLSLIYVGNRFYVSAAQKLKTLEAMARSPIYNQLSTTLEGLATIRSYRAEGMFVAIFATAQNLHTSTYFSLISGSRLFGIYLEVLCIVFICCLMAALNIQLDSYTGSVIGLTISQALSLSSNFSYGVRRYTTVETQMTSVQRVLEYVQLEKEPLKKSLQEPPDNWPQQGSIVYQKVSLCYPDGQMVLGNVSFNIGDCEKIGIVGRTGAGKSSLIVSLFRLTQPSGRIVIDSFDTATISLARLRACLAIIPQEPVMFSGNIRHNLDPFHQQTDQQLWHAIEKVQLKSKIQSFPRQLDNVVSESDFSVGQKQLICLARAILRKNRILILDEATANVDSQTDSLIQRTIRTEFAACTVLTIAHRLNTIIDYDRVMVLDGGTLVQFDTPYHLIELKSGIFYELFEHLNRDSRDELYKSALRVHLDKSNCLRTELN